MKISTAERLGQAILFPFIGITYDKNLYGNYEIFFGWLKWEVVISF